GDVAGISAGPAGGRRGGDGGGRTGHHHERGVHRQVPGAGPVASGSGGFARLTVPPPRSYSRSTLKDFRPRRHILAGDRMGASHGDGTNNPSQSRTARGIRSRPSGTG